MNKYIDHLWGFWTDIYFQIIQSANNENSRLLSLELKHFESVRKKSVTLSVKFMN